MDEDIVAYYKEKLERLEKKQIALEEWQKICFEILEKKMEENKDVFIRLKNRK